MIRKPKVNKDAVTIRISSNDNVVNCNNQPCTFYAEPVACVNCPIRSIYREIILSSILKNHSYIL